jgi:hypothetical protein
MALLPLQWLPSSNNGVNAKGGERYVGGWGRGDVIRRGEVGGREVGRREKFWGREEAKKN